MTTLSTASYPQEMYSPTQGLGNVPAGYVEKQFAEFSVVLHVTVVTNGTMPSAWT